MKTDLALVLSAILVGALSAYSADCWMKGMDRGRVELRRAKEDLISSAGLFELHNQIYLKIGPHAWETKVKPQFMSRLTYATIRETGSLFPEASDVVEWTRAHPRKAREMLEAAAAAAMDPSAW